MAENVDDILEIHVNDSDESFDVNNCNELNILFGETQFSVSQVLKRSATTAQQPLHLANLKWKPRIL